MSLDRRGVLALWQAIKPLNNVVSLLQVGVCPSDEHSDLLAYLSLGWGVRTGAAVATRGEGGINLVGEELGDALGVIRTKEMRSALQYLNSRALFLDDNGETAFDFGYCSSLEELWEAWDKEALMEKLVRCIRVFKPDVLLTCETGGDISIQHRALTILCEEAFHLANDEDAFTEHFAEGLKIWQVKKLYQPVQERTEPNDVLIPVNVFDRAYGATYTELGRESRAYYATQEKSNPNINDGIDYQYYRLLQDVTGNEEIIETSFFAGIPFTLEEMAKKLHLSGELSHLLCLLTEEAREALAAFPVFSHTAEVIQRMLAHVERAIALVLENSLASALRAELLHKLSIKRNQLRQASVLAHAIDLKIDVSKNILYPNEEIFVDVYEKNGGYLALDNVELQLTVPHGFSVECVCEKKSFWASNHSGCTRFKVKVLDYVPYYNYTAPTAFGVSLRYTSFGFNVDVLLQKSEEIYVLPPVSVVLQSVTRQAELSEEKSERSDFANLFVLSAEIFNLQGIKRAVNVRAVVPDEWQAEPKEQVVFFDGVGECGHQLEVQKIKFVLKTPNTMLKSAESFDDVAMELLIDGASEPAFEVAVFRCSHLGVVPYVRLANVILGI